MVIIKIRRLFIGLVGAVGTKQKLIVDTLTEKFKLFGYSSTEIRISKDVISKIYDVDEDKFANEYEIIND